MKADWVYRPRKYYLEDFEASSQGGSIAVLTYEPAFSGTYYNPMNMGSGAANATAQVLYDSARYTSSRDAVDLAADDQPVRYKIASSARPDMNRRGALIHGCEIGVYVHVGSQWLSASHLFLGMRIIVAPQEWDGRAQLDLGYSMWQNATPGEMFEPAVLANGRSNCWEQRFFRTRKTEDTELDVFIHHRFVPFKRRLAWDEGLFLYLEAHPNSIPLEGNDIINLWCRTLVTDYNR